MTSSTRCPPSTSTTYKTAARSAATTTAVHQSVVIFNVMTRSAISGRSVTTDWDTQNPEGTINQKV